MSNAIYVKPFTQIVEDVMYEMREANFADSKVEQKYQRRVNDVYQRMLPAEYEFWDFLKKRGYVTLMPALTTGTLTTVQDSATVTYSEGGMTVDQYIGYFLTIPSTNEVYEITANSATTFTISPAYIGDSASGLGFRVYKTVYALASDYEFMTTEPGFWIEQSGGRRYMDWDDERDWATRYTAQTSLYPTSIKEYTEKTTTGLFQVEVVPPVTARCILHYEYFKSLPEMREFTTGTATTTAGSTSVTLSADYSASISRGQYFRVDSDGTWKRISSVSGATVTLDSAYPTTLVTKAYTVSDAPEIPSYMMMSLFFGACMLSAQEQGGTQADVSQYSGEYKTIIANGVIKQNKKRYGRKILRFSSLQDVQHFKRGLR